MENIPQNPMVADDAQNTKRLVDIIRETRNTNLLEGDTVEMSELDTILRPTGLLIQLPIVSDLLLKKGNVREAETLQDILGICTLSKDFGGLSLDAKATLSPKDASEILFLVSAWMEALNSVDRSKSPMSSLQFRPEGRRGMTLSEKIFAAHDCAGRGEVKPGDLIVVDVDWVMASEISWHGMEKNYNDLGAPGIFRNDRLWIAGDHVVDPRVNHLPQIKKLIDSSERAKKVFKLVDYQGMNYTIMHTEFFRERAQPGMLIIGSDSHTCSSGALGCLAIGLGVADVTMPLVTGKTWFKVPETVRIHLVGTPSPGIGGKDIILYILKQLKRNTVAAERIVEFTGPGLQHLSCDARFAISNMTTEFGGITGIFVPDQNAYDFVEKRHLAKHKKTSRYFQPDEDASYVETYEVNLDKVEFSVAMYPSPDDVVPVSEVEGKHLDGCFIGACTTTEEDLILGALVLEQGMKCDLTPVKKGKRKIVPGSMPILHNLRQQGLTEVYERAGFEVGIPGCSYCVGMSADKAGSGEVWLSSQNRNFENRMGKGSIGNLASAATVAASSFDMKIADPRQLLNQIDLDRVRQMQNIKPKNGIMNTHESSRPTYVEPAPVQTHVNKVADEVATMTREPARTINTTIRQGKIQRLGDFIDTDALAPADSMMNPNTLGEHCLEYTHPDFRRKVKEGLNVVVAGKAFGCGSSRDVAVSALLAAGVICVIAESFAFIYARNQPALGLLGITISDPEFYETAAEGEDISIDVDNTTISVGGKLFTFKLAQMEKELIDAGGISEAFHKFGKLLFDVMCSPKAATLKRVPQDGPSGPTGDLKW